MYLGQCVRNEREGAVDYQHASWGGTPLTPRSIAEDTLMPWGSRQPGNPGSGWAWGPQGALGVARGTETPLGI